MVWTRRMTTVAKVKGLRMIAGDIRQKLVLASKLVRDARDVHQTMKHIPLGKICHQSLDQPGMKSAGPGVGEAIGIGRDGACGVSELSHAMKMRRS
jgi:hypothetical protein